VVIPTYNDQTVLSGVIEEVIAAGYSCVVVDDGSEPAASLASSAERTFLLRHSINLGQGAALQTGIEFALGRGAEHVVTFDSDGQHRVEDIARLIEPIERGQVEAALGSRFLPGGGAENIPRARLMLLRAAVVFTRFTTGLPLTDTHNGLRALSRSAALQMRITQNRMAHASDILEQIAEKKISFREIPVTIRYTDYSLARGQRMSNAFNILWDSFASLIRG